MLTSRPALRARSAQSRGILWQPAPAGHNVRRLALLGLLAAGAVVLLTGCKGSQAAAHAVSVSPTPTVAPAFVSSPLAVGDLSVVVRVAPATVGTSTVLVTVHRADGTAVTHAVVMIATQSLDMNMGTQTTQLQPSGDAGSYRGKVDLSMTGNWAITVSVLPVGATQPVTVRLPFTVGLW
jgi:YtkA-like